MYRIEKDHFGELEIPQDAYYGIHTARAVRNFRISRMRANPEFIRSLAIVKKACAAVNMELGALPEDKARAIMLSADEIIQNFSSDSFPVDALQGGAGTSTNMNINEVLANRALELLGREKGDYEYIHPVDHVNLHQSTNDVYPTALKIASVNLLRLLSNACAGLQNSLQTKEKEFASVCVPGRTEMQPAVPITLGSEFAAFAEAVARDRWRTFKAEERLRVVNIGGTAVGTGLTAPRKYIFKSIEKLRELTGLGLTRAESVMDATANNDVFAETGGMIAACAVNLIKIAKDLRLLHFIGEIKLPELQAGSSIMPGKVNPVICECVIQTGMKVISGDSLVKNLSADGTLQINEYMPLIAYTFLENIEILTGAVGALAEHIAGIRADEEVCRRHFEENESIITAFLPVWGYARCEELVAEFKASGGNNVREFLYHSADRELVDKTLSPAGLTSLGH